MHAAALTVLAVAVGYLAAATVSLGVEISNPGELISQLLTGSKPDEFGPPLSARQNVGSYNNNRRQSQSQSPYAASRPSYVQQQQPQQQQPTYETETIDVEPQYNNNAAPAALVEDQPEINNAYQSESSAAPAQQPYQQQQQQQSAKPTSYDPTPYADTLYCLDCQDKCGLQLAPQCPTGRGWYKHADSCYYFEPSIQLPWRDARGFCASLTDETGQQRGHLAIINDARENEYLRSLNHYLQKGGFPTMFWIDLATLLVRLNATAAAVNSTAPATGPATTAPATPVAATTPATATTTNATSTAAAAAATVPVEWFTFQANGFISSFRSMFNLFSQASGTNLCGLLEYFSADMIEAKRLQSELYWALDSCTSQRPPLCEIDLNGNPFN